MIEIKLSLYFNKAEIDVLLELSRFLDDPVDVGNPIPGSRIAEA